MNLCGVIFGAKFANVCSVREKKDLIDDILCVYLIPPSCKVKLYLIIYEEYCFQNYFFFWRQHFHLKSNPKEAYLHF